jgi:hypothetical protein
VTTPPGPEAIRYLPEPGFKERLDDLFYGTGGHTIFYYWHPEGAELPRFTRLGYPLSPCRARYVGARTELLSQTLKECGFPLPLDVLDGDPVDARRSLALPRGNRSPGTPQIAQVDNPTLQLTVLSFRVFPTPLEEFSLHAE